jgi:DNA invertase Pin-like site-specific DNA recombinase
MTSLQGGGPPPQRKAAQYLRRSTAAQPGSLQIQIDAIAMFAEQIGCDLVATYVDDGVSGVSIRERTGLQSLLADVTGGAAAYDLILVYDISRWGRFQNPDQGAHYEFICMEAGIEVAYCAEAFENDRSLSTTLLKALRRSMAAEYSRELSEKVRVSKRGRTVEGWWPVGPPALGLRRQVVDAFGRSREILEDGQRKEVRDHRVTLTPGPEAEVALVNRIFDEFVSGRTRRDIAQRLNADGLTTSRGLAWLPCKVTAVLRDRKYIGDLTYNRVRKTLTEGRVGIPRREWRTVEGAWPAIVDRAVFDRAQEIIRVSARARNHPGWTPKNDPGDKRARR